MQEVSDKWKQNQLKQTLNQSYVVIHIYDANDNEIYKATSNEIIDFTLDEEAYYLDNNLPKYECKFTLDNSKGIFDIDNESGLYNQLKVRNKVVVDIGYNLAEDGGEDIEWIDGGTYYLSEWKISNNSLTANFTAECIIYFLTNIANYRTYQLGKIKYDGKSNFTMNGRDGESISSLISNVLINTDISKYVSKNTVNSCYTFNDRINTLLQELAQCGRTQLYVQRGGRYQIYVQKHDLQDDPTDYEITEFNSFEYPEITIENEINTIEVEWTLYSDAIQDLTDAEKSNNSLILFDGSIRSSNTLTLISDTELGYYTKIYTYSGDQGGPNTWYINNSSETLDINSVEVGADGLSLAITFATPGTAVLDSYNITIFKQTIVEQDNIYLYKISDGDIVQSVSNPFITSESSAKANAEWIKEYLFNRRVIECSYRADPRLDPLDIITIYKKYGGTEKAMVERIKYTWSGGMFHGELRARHLSEWSYDMVINNISSFTNMTCGKSVSLRVTLNTYADGQLYKSETATSSDLTIFTNTTYISSSGLTITAYNDGTITIDAGKYGTQTINATIKWNAFADASWTEIDYACKLGKYKDLYSVGDKKSVTLNSQTSDLIILDFDHYYINGTVKTACICCGFSWASSVGREYWSNSYSSADNFPSSAICSHINDGSFLPSDSTFNSLIQDVTYYYMPRGSTASSQITSAHNKILIPSMMEIYGTTAINNSTSSSISPYTTLYEAEGYQYKLFSDLNLTSVNTDLSKYIYNDTWTRSWALPSPSIRENYYAWQNNAISGLTSVIVSNVSGAFVIINLGVEE